MNKLPTRLIAVLMLISTAASSLAVESTTTRSAITVPVQLTAPTVLAKNSKLNAIDLAKYQNLAIQSQGLTSQQAAGASSTTKIVLLSIGALVLITVLSGNFA